MYGSLRRSLSFWFATLLSGALGWPSARAQDAPFSCQNSHVHVVGLPPARWHASLQTLCDLLGRLPDVDPTAELTLEATDDEARIDVTLGNGRHATRAVHSPDALFRTAEALVVMPAFEPEATTLPPLPVPRSAPTPPPPPPPPPAAVQPAAKPINEPTFALGASFMGRLARAPTYWSVGGELYADLRLNDWLLGLLVRWDGYEMLASHRPEGFESESVGAGFSLVHQLVRKDWYALHIGGSALLLATTQALERIESIEDQSTATLRVGLLARLLFGDARLRWTVTFETELSPMSLRKSPALYEPLPTWGLGLGLGLAWDVQ
jgi:hypothetical protein